MKAACGQAQRLQRGFTLIEVMVVVVILGILATLVLPNVLGRVETTRIKKAATDVKQIVASLELYKLDNLRYPAGDVGLDALDSPPNGGPGYFKGGLPVDPWGNAYQYVNPGVHGEVDVFSFGADGAPGGEGANADIGSWQNQ